MKLIVIYGPPAAGKLTVAKELAEITGYKVLHNHLVIDMVESVFSRENPMFWKLIDDYRLDIIGKASGENGLIMTLVNIKGKDDSFIQNVIKITKDNGGEVNFVRLTCNQEELKKRLKNNSRKAYGKLMDEEIFNQFVTQNDVFSQISFIDSLDIDNTKTSAKDAAEIIKRHYVL
jgi:broad-specificity NMP kinase